MKKILNLILLGVLASPLVGQEGAPENEKKGDIFANLDVATRVQLMKKYDKDGDGRLNKEERAEAMKALREKSEDLENMKEKHAEEVIKKFDTDGDGKLDSKELMGFLEEQRQMMEKAREGMMRRRGNFNPPKEILAKYDKDGDGKLSAEERKAMFKDAAERRANLIKKYDEDGDGKLSDAERLKLSQDPEVQTMMKRMLENQPTPPPQGN